MKLFAIRPFRKWAKSVANITRAHKEIENEYKTENKKCCQRRLIMANDDEKERQKENEL